ncbi:MAG: hypothetical protein ACRYFS_15125 [Janthinobacterium lividum]
MAASSNEPNPSYEVTKPEDIARVLRVIQANLAHAAEDVEALKDLLVDGYRRLPLGQRVSKPNGELEIQLKAITALLGTVQYAAALSLSGHVKGQNNFTIL